MKSLFALRIILPAALVLAAAPSARAYAHGETSFSCTADSGWGDPNSAVVAPENSASVTIPGWTPPLDSTSKGNVYCNGGLRLDLDSARALYVNFFDYSSTDGVTCLAQVRALFTDSIVWSAWQQSPASYLGYHSFLFEIPSGHIGHVDVHCSIPAPAETGYSSLIGAALLPLWWWD